MPYRVMYTTNIDKSLLERIHHVSSEANIRPNQLLEEAIIEYLEHHEHASDKNTTNNPQPHRNVQ